MRVVNNGKKFRCWLKRTNMIKYTITNIALHTSTHNEDGTIDTIAILHDWPQLGE